MDLDFIPSANSANGHLSSIKLQENLRIMEKGNKLLKKWANQLYGKRKRRTFRELLVKGQIVRGKDIPAEDYDAIIAVWAIQEDMLRGFSKLITIRAKRWAIKHARSLETESLWIDVFHDFYQEANLAFLDALYGYLGACKGASFITYTWRVVDRRLRRIANNEKMQLIPQTGDGARGLLKNYETFKQKCGRYITFDEYVIENNLTEEESSILSHALIYVVRESEMGRPAHVLLENDWTGKKEESAAEQLETQELIDGVQKCLEMANLTPFQLELLKSSQHHGWKADLARKYNVSRTYAGQAYNQAVEKVRRIYKQIHGE